MFLNSSIKMVDLVELWVDRLDVVDELKVLACIGGVHDVLLVWRCNAFLSLSKEEFALNLRMSGNSILLAIDCVNCTRRR